MPELPEVETIVRGLAPVVVGRVIREVVVHDRRLRTPIPVDLATALAGRRITAMHRHGKYLLAALDDGRSWLVHLGMSGRLTLVAATTPRQRHDHVVVVLDDAKAIVYHDPRRFGRMDVVMPDQLATATGLGIDALSERLTPAVLHGLTRRRRTSIKALLMDQRLVAGLGNIYVNELLFRAEVRPRRAARGLSRSETGRLHQAMRAVLEQAIALGGSSIADYRDGFGGYGRFQDAHRVYDRAGQPCGQCGATIRGLVIVGRSSFYCPGCQR